MTPSQLLQRVPLMREFFTKEIQQEWSLAEYLVAFKEQQERTLAALDGWRGQSSKIEND